MPRRAHGARHVGELRLDLLALAVQAQRVIAGDAGAALRECCKPTSTRRRSMRWCRSAQRPDRSNSRPNGGATAEFHEGGDRHPLT